MASDKIQSQNSKTVRKKTIAFFIKRMSVLESAKIHFKILGCLPIDQQNWPLRLKKIPCNQIHIGFTFFILILNLLSTCWFYICEVKTFIDFSEAVFWVSRAILALALYSMFIWQKSDFIKLFNDLEDIVDRSKSQMNLQKKFSIHAKN